MKRHCSKDEFIKETYDDFLLSYKSILLDFKLECEEFRKCLEKEDIKGMNEHQTNAEKDLWYLRRLERSVINFNNEYGIQ